MSVERQQGELYQDLLFELDESVEKGLRPGASSDRVSGTSAIEEKQSLAEINEQRALTMNLMEQVVERSNLNRAYRKVRTNRGSAGVDGMTIDQMRDWIAKHKETLIASLLDGSYRPQPIRGVQIPKPGGKGMRQLGIPTVIDRLVQQAILQVLDPILDASFSESSYGFRGGRSAHDALLQASQYVESGRTTVVDMDLAKFFDRVNHDILLSRLARRIADKRLLRIIRRFLVAGMMSNGVCVARHQGTPQGGPLSPLLANLMLDELDKELESRGHCFCRYADDCNIYVRSQTAGERVLTSVTHFLDTKLKLQVNREKSAVAPVDQRQFLGHRLMLDGTLTIAPASLQRVKARIRQITRRNRGVSFKRVIGEVNSLTTGWVTYFRHTCWRTPFRDLEQWIRRKLRCYRLKQCKRAQTIAKFLQGLGVPVNQSWTTAACGKGWWRMSGTHSAQHGMSNAWFNSLGFASLSVRYTTLNHQQKPPDTMSTSGGVGGRKP